MALASAERRAAIKKAQEERISDQPAGLDVNMLNEAEANMGVPVTPENFYDYVGAAYSPDQLAQAGVSDQYQQELNKKRAEAEYAMGGIQGAQQYMPTGLSVLENALKEVSGVGQMQTGGSELYRELGIKGYGALTASLAQTANEQKAKYNSFANALNAVGMRQNFEFQQNLSKYTQLMKEYEGATKKIDDILAKQRAVENNLSLHKDKALINQQIELENEAIKQQNRLEQIKIEHQNKIDQLKAEGKYVGGGFTGYDSWASSIGYGTEIKGSPWTYGIDIDGDIGDPVTAPLSGKVVSVFTEGKPGDGSNGGWGNNVILEVAGKHILLNHLQDVNVGVGDYINAGDLVGTMGNTGNVKDINGKTPTPEQLAQGVGGHTDITMLDPSIQEGDPYFTTDETKQFISRGGMDMTRGELKELAEDLYIGMGNTKIDDDVVERLVEIAYESMELRKEAEKAGEELPSVSPMEIMGLALKSWKEKKDLA